MNNYSLLSRLQMDCEYFIKTSSHVKHLWAGNVKDQIFKMKQIWLRFAMDAKPEWLSYSQIEKYEKQMNQIDSNKIQPKIGDDVMVHNLWEGTIEGDWCGRWTVKNKENGHSFDVDKKHITEIL